MPVRNYKNAYRFIRILQQELSTLRHDTYHTVHDQIGSNISAVSIKAKVLTDKLKDTYEKQQLGEIHSIVKETMEHVTLLNKKLKTSWVVQGSDTLLKDLKNEFEKIESKFGIHIDFQTIHENNLKKLNFQSLMIIYEVAQHYLHDAISRISSQIFFTLTVFPDRTEWKFMDSGPLPPETETYRLLNEKMSIANGTLHLLNENEKHGILLVLPTKDEK